MAGTRNAPARVIQNIQVHPPPSQEAFNEVDKDGDGIVASRELSSLTRTLGIPCTDTEIERMIKSLDDDGSNTMDFPEFLELMNQKMFPTLLGQTDMAKLFQQVDVDHKKCIRKGGWPAGAICWPPW
eukprot:EG_transcript_39258